MGRTTNRDESGWRLPVLSVAMAGLAGGVMQAHIPVNRDCGYFIYVLREIINGSFAVGGDYPISLSLIGTSNIWMYLPSSLLNIIASVPPSVSVYIETMALFSIASIYFISLLLRFVPPLVSAAWILAFGLLCLLFPVDWFGERDQLAFFCLVPYVLRSVARAEGIDWKPGRRWPVALLAAGALVIKAHYALVPVLLESLLAWRTRSLKPLFSPFNIAVLALSGSYYLYLWNEIYAGSGGMHSVYMKYYMYFAGNDLLTQLIFRKYVLVWGLALAAWPLARGGMPSTGGGDVLYLAWIGGLGGGILQTGIDYQLFPATGFAFLSITWPVLRLEPPRAGWRRLSAIGLASVLVLLLAGRTVLAIPGQIAGGATVTALSEALRRQGGEDGVLWLRTDFNPMYAALLDSGSRRASRFASFVFIPAIMGWTRAHGLAKPPEEVMKAVEAAVVEDFARTPPRIIVRSDADDAELAPLLTRPAIRALLDRAVEVERIENFRFLRPPAGL